VVVDGGVVVVVSMMKEKQMSISME